MILPELSSCNVDIMAFCNLEQTFWSIWNVSVFEFFSKWYSVSPYSAFTVLFLFFWLGSTGSCHFGAIGELKQQPPKQKVWLRSLPESDYTVGRQFKKEELALVETEVNNTIKNIEGHELTSSMERRFAMAPGVRSPTLPPSALVGTVAGVELLGDEVSSLCVIFLASNPQLSVLVSPISPRTVQI